MNKLSPISRILLAVASLAIISTYFLPVWEIYLWAPQYPEGLNMKIWLSKLSGDVAIINGLNHYIGMRHISEEMFPEFQYMGILVGILIALGLVAAIVGRRVLLVGFIGLALVYGAAALYDFYRWGYDYGHNLDPNAAIKVPGMAYQPPVIGYKNLLNFMAYSGPDIGGWIVIGAGLIALGVLIYEWYFRGRRKAGPAAQPPAAALVLPLAALLSLQACAVGPEPIRYGQDECANCKMTLTDKRYGAEIVSKKGKVFKYDDLDCLVAALDAQVVPTDQVAHIVAVDFNKTNAFVDVNQAFFLQSEALKSPMRSDIAVFATGAERAAVQQQIGGGQTPDWAAIREQFKK